LVPDRAFGRHRDDHAVLAIQITEAKLSRLWPPKEEPGVSEAVPSYRFVLRPGQALLVPRGWWHDVCVHTAASLHVTVGILRRSWKDFIDWLVAIGREEVAGCGDDLPGGADWPVRSSGGGGHVRAMLSQRWDLWKDVCKGIGEVDWESALPEWQEYCKGTGVLRTAVHLVGAWKQEWLSTDDGVEANRRRPIIGGTGTHRDVAAVADGKIIELAKEDGSYSGYC
jgi:hypothetical protein